MSFPEKTPFKIGMAYMIHKHVQQLENDCNANPAIVFRDILLRSRRFAFSRTGVQMDKDPKFWKVFMLD